MGPKRSHGSRRAGAEIGAESREAASLKRIGFVGYNGATGLDLFGPIEVFDTANKIRKNESPAYELVVLSATGKPFMLEQEVFVSTHSSFENALPLDTVIVPGGAGARETRTSGPIVEWLKNHQGQFRRIASVCVGSSILAAAGLLDGRRAATHWALAEEFSGRFPAIRVEPDSIFVRDGAVYTSAGVTAGIDLSLHLVEEDLGSEIALAVARQLVVYLKRTGGQSQFSEPLKFQIMAADQFSELANWILQNLRGDLSVEALAQRSNLGSRQFNRRFRQAFDASPGEYVEHLRLDEARRRLSDTRQSLDRVAESVGYASTDAFRRAFERRFGTSPNAYRLQFFPDGSDKSRCG